MYLAVAGLNEIILLGVVANPAFSVVRAPDEQLIRAQIERLSLGRFEKLARIQRPELFWIRRVPENAGKPKHDAQFHQAEGDLKGIAIKDVLDDVTAAENVSKNEDDEQNC